MQAILVADYSFAPAEYWRGVSQVAREFIKRCLTVDPQQRITAHQALQHEWIKPVDPSSPEKPTGDGADLLPVVKKNFNARRTLHKAIDTVRAINKLREGGGLMAGHMDGAMSVDPKPKAEMVNGSKVMDDEGQHMEGLEGMAHGSSGALNSAEHHPAEHHPAEHHPAEHHPAEHHPAEHHPAEHHPAKHHPAEHHPGHGDAMMIDSRSNGRGQTEEQIRLQEKRIHETMSGMWTKNRS